jgi:hypothetical protein
LIEDKHERGVHTRTCEVVWLEAGSLSNSIEVRDECFGSLVCLVLDAIRYQGRSLASPAVQHAGWKGSAIMLGRPKTPAEPVLHRA